jgi:phosphatidylglycerol---prolipoprotein diacylglyceryl transferase
MIDYPNISPTILEIGPLQIRWYGLSYIMGIFIGFAFFKPYLVKKYHLSLDDAYNCMLYTIVGIILGGRLGYVLFYDLSYFISKPLEIFAVWHGGMSYHGGALGCVIALILYSLRYKVGLWGMLDLLGVSGAVAQGLGRIANFINGELYGRVSNVPWAMVFPKAGVLPRHPSQLYEAFLEGFVLFVVLYVLLRKNILKTGQLFAVYLVLYGLFRVFVEFFREPDIQIGYILGFFTMGQLLSSIMIIGGLIIFFIKGRKGGE